MGSTRTARRTENRRLDTEASKAQRLADAAHNTWKCRRNGAFWAYRRLPRNYPETGSLNTEPIEDN